MSDLHPEHGARVLFELEDDRAPGARYAVSLFLPEGELHCGNGQVEHGSEKVELLGAAEAPEWVRTLVLRLLRQIAAGQRSRQPPRWPRRIMRWRATPGPR